MKSAFFSDQRGFFAPEMVASLFRHRRQVGLNEVEEAVLATLVEAAALLPGEPAVAMSRYEIAKQIDTPHPTVQRALNSLVAKGLISRKQDEKKYGSVAISLVTRAAFAYFGLQGGAAVGAGGLPSSFGPLLARESEEFIAQIAAAWDAGRALNAAETSQYRGPARDLAQIEFLLASRVETLAAETMQAIADAEAAEADLEQGVLRVPLSDNTELVLDQKAHAAIAQSFPTQISSVLLCADMRIVRDVFELIRKRSPERLTAKNAPHIAAEVLFSRHKGFAIKHDAEAAGRIMANTICRGTWTRPRGMLDAWYSAAASAVRVVRPQGVQLCAA